MIQAKTYRKHLFTPLRYPGGKTSLFAFFDTVIKEHEWKDVVYIEPYAGGAGAALSLLLLEKVNSIVINDYDPAIYSFWLALKEHNAEFVERVSNTPVTVKEWERQKKSIKRPIRPIDYLLVFLLSF
jgi:DNA adenine methylase